MTKDLPAITRCRSLGELHARHVRLQGRAAEPAVAAELAALEAEIEHAVVALVRLNAQASQSGHPRRAAA